MRIVSFTSRVAQGLLAAAIGVAGVAGCTPQTVIQNSVPAANAPSHGITVNGVGKANGTPNVARVTVGVEVRAATAELAIAEVNARVAQVIAAVKQAGVADADVRTATLSLNFERVYEPPQPVEMAPSKAKPAAEKPESAPAAPAPRLPQGFYNAVNNVELTIRNLDAAGNVVSAATSAGADQVFGIRFEIEDTSALQAEARSQAVADARQRAERLAQLAGVKLGPAVSILETDGGGSGPVPGYAMMKTAAAPIERGELTVTSSVQIVYALGE
jgi:uncharacterized protein